MLYVLMTDSGIAKKKVDVDLGSELPSLNLVPNGHQSCHSSALRTRNEVCIHFCINKEAAIHTIFVIITHLIT